MLRGFWRNLASLTLLALIGFPILSQPRAHSSGAGLAEEDIKAIEEIMRAYPAAWLANEPDKILALFSEVAVLLPHHGVPPVEGKTAIRRFWFPPNASPSGVSEFTMQFAEVFGENGFAVGRGRSSLTFWFMSEGNRETMSFKGNYLMVFRKGQDNKWRIARYIWNDPPPQ